MKSYLTKTVFSIVLVALIYTIYCNHSNKNHQAPPTTKEEFQISLASKFQLYKVRIDQIKAAGEILLAVTEEPDQSKKETMLEELAKKSVTTRNIALKGLLGNCYTADKAKLISNLWEKKSDAEVETIFNQLDNEIRAEMKIAQSLGIDINYYESEYKQHAFDYMILMMLVSSTVK